MRVVCILNGSKSGSRRLAAELVRTAPPGYSAVCHLTERRGHAIDMAAAHAASCDLLVAVGGDGTLHECLNGLMRAHQDGITLPGLALIPLGTGNDLGRHFKWKKGSASDLWIRAGRASFLHSDVGHLRTDTSSHYFLNAMDAGFGAMVARIADRMPSFLPGSVQFGLAILFSFPAYKKERIHFISDTDEHAAPTLTLVIANGRTFGGGIVIAPEADMADGWLDITWIGDVSLLDYLRYLPALRKGKKILHPEVRYGKMRSGELDGKAWTELDGEAGPSLPVRVEVIRAAIRLLV